VLEITYRIRNQDKELPQESQEFWQLREQILTHELVVLQTIAFDLRVEHPYTYLLSYVKGIQGNRQLAQVAWNFVNDGLRTALFLQFKPQLIASAAIYLASKFLKYQLPEGKKPWWEVFDAKIEDLEEISNQILDLYESSPSMEAIKSSSTLTKLGALKDDDLNVHSIHTSPAAHAQPPPPPYEPHTPPPPTEPHTPPPPAEPHTLSTSKSPKSSSVNRSPRHSHSPPKHSPSRSYSPAKHSPRHSPHHSPSYHSRHSDHRSTSRRDDRHPGGKYSSSSSSVSSSRSRDHGTQQRSRSHQDDSIRRYHPYPH